jgi:predicted dehydrogenase
MEKLRIGVIGAGGVAQFEHIPNLIALPDLFDLSAVADPSPGVRAFVTRRWGVAALADPQELIGTALDAVIVASPDALHVEHVSAALAAGLHVFCEKPLCYAASDIRDLARLRDKSGKVLQTGYMKRFDPSYEALLRLLPDQAGTLRQVAVEVTDPDALPFVQHRDWHSPADLPDTATSELRAKQAEQVARAVPVPLDDTGYRGFCSAYASSLVHDVNAVHGILDLIGARQDGVVGAAFFAGGRGGQGAVSLNGGAALWTLSHLSVPDLPHYSERITLTFDASALELEFPSPWLNHAPTRLIERRGSGTSLTTRLIRTGYGEAFVEELKGFHRAVTQGAPVRNTAEDAARDMELLAELAVCQALRGPGGKGVTP